ncbi:glyceraldehyde 3-phosphate dehydrogenase NAD-binding domain-containing protein [Puniceibacterium confluentis]|uniref:glyceraldehyde 3-phosphate dehydrogenase NAD-binding domain-containing protein n=1 Tax=Puniceibacterium confluentis TaxID=1958944 RepID=UPI0011B3C77D
MIAQSVGIGEARHAIASGMVAPADVTEIGALINAADPGCTSDAEIPLFDGTGAGLQDLAVAAKLVKLAHRNGTAVSVDFQGKGNDMRVALNGFGRIGRTILRQLLATHSDITVALINDIAPLDTCAYLFRYDSVFGPFPGEVRTDPDALIINDQTIPFRQKRDLADLDLSDVDVVMDCTGTISTRAHAARGLTAGARNVLISGPCDEAEQTIVLGANAHLLADARIVSNASCTTNALAPLLRVLQDSCGVVQGHMTTIHCYTGSQPMVDAPRGDLARSRAGAVSMVPTTTSATRLIDRVLPDIAGRVTGAAVRVPVISVSAIDLVVTLKTLPDQPLADHLACIAQTSAVLGVTRDATVSTDLRARPESLVIALPETIQSGNQARIFGWYDNEWGFSARMIDMARLMAAR